MSAWKLSRFTSIFPGEQGELLVCNSFMGALTRIPVEFGDSLRQAAECGVDASDPAPPLDLLCSNGYFVPGDFDETPAIASLLERERDRSGQELIIMPQENCNFRCVYCYEDFSRGLMSKEIVQGVKTYVDRMASTWGRVHISWFGGEPLLAKSVVYDLSDSVIARCREAEIRFSAAMTTNGYYLTPEVAQKLLEREVRMFQITVDGPKSEHDNRRRLAKGGPTYRTILDNLVALRERNDKFTVRLRVNFDPSSYGAIEGWFDEIAPLFAGDERFHLAFHPIGKWGGANDENLDVCGESDGWRYRLRLNERASEHGFAPATYRHFLSSHGATCYAGRAGSMVIGSDGRIYKCTVAFDDPRNQVGQLFPDGSVEIDAQKWNRWVSTDGLETGKCGSCWFHASCQSRACPLVAMEHNEPPCPSSRQEIGEILRLAAYGG